MKECSNHINLISKGKIICGFLIMMFALLGHFNFIFSDFVSSFDNDPIELSELGENESENESENEKEKEEKVKEVKNYNLTSLSIYALCLKKREIGYKPYSIHDLFIDVFTPPPEFI